MEKSQKSRTILVADDDRDVNEIAKAFFTTRGHTVLSAFNGADCVELARKHSPDIIVLDMKMPGMDGVATARYLMADSRTSTIPILAVSGLANMQADALRAGCEGFVLKPVLPRELLDRIELVLADRDGTKDRSGFG